MESWLAVQQLTSRSAQLNRLTARVHVWDGGYPRLQSSRVTPVSWWCYSYWPSPPYFVPQVP